MKKNEWNEGLDHLDPEIVEKYIEQIEILTYTKQQKLPNKRLLFSARKGEPYLCKNKNADENHRRSFFSLVYFRATYI